MSFFDDGDESPTTQRRRPATARFGAGNDQALRNRRLVAAGIGLVVVVLLILGVRSCVDSARQSGLRTYARDVSSLSQESKSQVGTTFFRLLTSGAQAIELESQADTLRATADEQVKRAQRLDVPGEMAEAQRDFVLSLVLRRDAITRIASKLGAALSNDGAQTAIPQIAGQMEAFLASDVIFSQQVVPLIHTALASNGLGSEPLPPTDRFLDNLSWLTADYVGQQLGSPSTPSAPTGQAAPGTHGHGLDGVTAGAVDLQAGQTNRISTAGLSSIVVKFTNQGENDEAGVVVKVTISGGGGAPIVLNTRVAKTLKGQSATATLSVKTPPPVGVALTLKAEIAAVPGEKNLANNSQTYPVTFTK